jgi:hypothetical protein
VTTWLIILLGAAATALVLAAAAILINRPEPGRHAVPRAPRRTFPAAGRYTAPDVFADYTDRDKELWVDGLLVEPPDDDPAPDDGREHGPAAPARRPRLLAIARVRTAALIRALPVDAAPHLQPGQYEDSTGTFAALMDGDPDA